MTSRQRQQIWLLVAGAAILAAHWLDPWGYRSLGVPSAGERDWGRLLRVIGYLPTWGAVALAFWLESRRDRPANADLAATAKSVIVAVVVAGLAGELLKLLIRRERPNATSGLYQFRPFDVDPFSTSRLGMPSTHAVTAFAGAGALSRRYPRAAPVLLALAAGCGLTRVFAQAHFLSDVVVGGIGGGWVGSMVAARFRRNLESR